MTFTAHKLTDEEIADAIDTYDSQIRPLVDELLARTKQLGLPVIVNVLIANKSTENPETGVTHGEGISRFSGWGRDNDPIGLVIAYIALNNFFDYDDLRQVIAQPSEAIRAYLRLMQKLRALGIDRWDDALMQFSEDTLLEMLNAPVSPSDFH